MELVSVISVLSVVEITLLASLRALREKQIRCRLAARAKKGSERFGSFHPAVGLEKKKWQRRLRLRRILATEAVAVRVKIRSQPQHPRPGYSPDSHGDFNASTDAP